MEPLQLPETTEHLVPETESGSIEKFVGKLLVDQNIQLGEDVVDECLIPKFSPENYTPLDKAAQEIGVSKTGLRRFINRNSYSEHISIHKKPNGHQGLYLRKDAVDEIRKVLGEHSVAPDGWMTFRGASRTTGRSSLYIKNFVEDYKEVRPDWFEDFKDSQGRVNTHLSPEIVQLINEEICKYGPAPNQWTTNHRLSKELGRSENIVREVADLILKDHPEWTSEFRDKLGRIFRYYHPEAIKQITSSLNCRVEQSPDSWWTKTGLAKDLGCTKMTIQRVVEKVREGHDDWFKTFQVKSNYGTAEHYHPELVELIRAELGRYELAPEGWETNENASKQLGIDRSTVKRIASYWREEKPDWSRIYKDRSNKPAEHYHPELVELIRAELGRYELAPEGWETKSRLARESGKAHGTVQRIGELFREEHPEWFQIYKDRGHRLVEHYSPELVLEINSFIDKKTTTFIEQKHFDEERERLNQRLKGFLAEVSSGETLESQEFQKLIQLFGSERVVDILFQYRPEYQKISLPFAKRVIGDYLGEFLVIRGDLQLDNLEKGVQYLSDPNLKQGLTEVIKSDCLRFYNQLCKEGLVHDDLLVFTDYINNLREQTENYSTAELTEVLNEVEGYYKALSEVIQIPDNVVDELEPGRLFPDINQRINILELMGKKKMLIADEMGVGKSASAILAKESLGAKQALVVVPSNVVEVWQKYLSDYKNGDGEAIGYFKEGQAPRVLIISSLESLNVINPAEYDYVVISQERLTDDYMAALEKFDHDMLIVDEAHKLKNITSGKRAENLIKLAEKIEGDDKYLALLSGTPVPNKVGDIAIVLKLLYPEKFEDVSNKDLTRQILEGDILDLRSLLVPRMQMKSLTESIEMPALHQETHIIEMSKEERQLYEVMLEEDELTASRKLQILRQFVLNPQIFEATPGLGSSKIQEVGNALRNTYLTKDKVIMFVNGYVEGVIRGEKTIFDDLNLPADVEVQIIDGKVSKAKRLEIQERLRGHNGKILLAVSAQTADVGVDFSGAQELYFYNEPWTEYDKKQQQGRVYRPGLKEDLASHIFYVQGTVEEGIHRYIEFKYNAVEKLLRGIPLSELERKMLKEDEKQVDPNLEVNPTLAEHYLSSWDRMLKIYNHVKEIGEQDFVKFLGRYGREYAECYTDLGSRSYQANAGRLSGTVIDKLTKSRNQDPEFVRILDVASGPEMLKRHIGEEYQNQVVSVDINPHHFDEIDEKRRVGSFLNLPVADSTVDYANLSLALHYSKFLPSRDNYERIEVFKELNRVLVRDGIVVINTMHTLDLKYPEVFKQAIERVGFKILEKYSGEVSSANNFRTRLLILQKINDCPQATPALVRAIGSQLIVGFKFKKTDIKLRDSRRIATSFTFEDEKRIKARVNQSDQRILDEERHVLKQMSRLKRLYGVIQNIPKEQILENGLSRAFTGKTYVLFKSLESGHGAVITW